MRGAAREARGAAPLAVAPVAARAAVARLAALAPLPAPAAAPASAAAANRLHASLAFLQELQFYPQLDVKVARDSVRVDSVYLYTYQISFKSV